MPSDIHRHQRRNLILIVLGLIFAIVLSRLPFFSVFLNSLGKYEYLSAFLAGLLFSSTFTVAIGALILVTLTQTLSPFILVPLAVLGAISGDLLIFLFVRNRVVTDVIPTYKHFADHSHFKKILHTHYFSWTLPVLGAIIIASPLPDELGVSLFGLSEITLARFALIAALSHTLGISLVVLTGSLVS